MYAGGIATLQRDFLLGMTNPDESSSDLTDMSTTLSHSNVYQPSTLAKQVRATQSWMHLFGRMKWIVLVVGFRDLSVALCYFIELI